MNWLILIIAGLCETGFAFCLGKTKLAVGTEYYLHSLMMMPLAMMVAAGVAVNDGAV